jgi:hypothetical protein
MRNSFTILAIFVLPGCASMQERRKEAEKADREQLVAEIVEDVHDRLWQVENSIKILSYNTGRPNSAGGVNAYFRYTNLNEKTIKYLIWEAYPINAVGDAVTCDIRDHSAFRGKDTGPIEQGQSGGSGYWENAWYNHKIKEMVLTGIHIEYMDGTTLQIEGSDLYSIGKVAPRY